MGFTNSEKRSSVYPALFLFLVAFLIRFPFFFRDYIDRDESTFILMGQSIADGHLPYDYLWDLKPPLLFYIFGFVEYLFPDALVAIRFLGVLIVFSSALLLVRIAKKEGLKNAWLTGLLYIVLSSEFGNIQGLMSEHLSVFFLLLGFLFFRKRKKTIHFLIAGVAFGCALLCKLNYAYAVVALMAYYLILHGQKAVIGGTLRSLFVTGLGMCIPVLLITLPFALQDKISLFINSVFLAPFEYGHSERLTLAGKFGQTWWVIGFGLIFSYLAWKKAGNQTREIVYASLAIVWGTIYTYFSTGSVNGHYLIQIFPFLSLISMGVLIPGQWDGKLFRIGLLVLLLSGEAIYEYYRVISNYAQTSSLYYGKGVKAVKIIKNNGLENRRAFFASYHIGYWFLHQYPLSKSTTHPSNLRRAFLFKYFENPRTTSLEELKYIMEVIRPGVVISKYPHLEFFPPEGPENLYFKSVLSGEFKLIYQEKNMMIWQRN